MNGPLISSFFAALLAIINPQLPLWVEASSDEDGPANVQTRLFGLILTAIAAQLIVEGLGETFPQWLSAS